MTPVSLLATEPEHYSERLVVWNPVTGESQSTGYALIQDGTVVDKGRTTDDGFATRRLKKEGAQLRALVGGKGAWAVEYHSGDNAHPPVSNDESDSPKFEA
jgi:IS4 transposase